MIDILSEKKSCASIYKYDSSGMLKTVDVYIHTHTLSIYIYIYLHIIYILAYYIYIYTYIYLHINGRCLEGYVSFC